MEIKRETVMLREIVPSEGMIIKNIKTGEFYPEGLHLGKDENEADYIEVDASEMPVETDEELESGGE